MRKRLTPGEQARASDALLLSERALQIMLRRAEAEGRRHGRALDRATRRFERTGAEVDRLTEETAAMASTALRVVRECIALLRIARENPRLSAREAAQRAEMEAWQ